MKSKKFKLNMTLLLVAMLATMVMGQPDLTLDNWLKVGNMSGSWENEITGSRSVAFGNRQNVHASDSLASGENHTIYSGSTASLVSGATNRVSGLRASALGALLDSFNSHGTALGYMNKHMVGTFLCVGNGDGSTGKRRNAFEIYSNGDLIVPSNDYNGTTPRFQVLNNGDVIVGDPQGDIEMGSFQ